MYIYHIYRAFWNAIVSKQEREHMTLGRSALKRF